jgi:two-component system, cell cycle sensor histidine kinase and response regulator CckA
MPKQVHVLQPRLAALIVDKIFEPFFSTNKGTGLGLATVFGIVQQSEGFIFLDPLYKGGAKFRIFFHRHLDQTEQIKGVH